MKIGVLAIQGDFAAHLRVLAKSGVDRIEVRDQRALQCADGLIIPGGESTTLLKIINEENLAGSIRQFALSGKPVFGTCAGAILLASEVLNPNQESLDLINISVERNAYGRQVDSFIEALDSSLGESPLEAVFIRAPKILSIGRDVEVLAKLKGEPVLVREGRILAATFHPELTEDERVHRLFVQMVAESN